MDVPEPIAIVSAACRLPGHISSPHTLWNFLQTGGIAVSDVVPSSRFSGQSHFDGSGKPGTIKALSGMFIEDIDPASCDASFFNLTRADANAMDPQQRQLLEVVYECFENGGIPIDRVSGTETGCFVGSYTVDYHDMQNRSPGQRVPGMTVGIGRAILSNRISHFFNLKGSSLTIDTACSGGLIGVDTACQYLRAGKLSGAIVAAVNLWLSPEHTQELGSMRAAYSPSGRCHTFDAKADGYCRAEAVNAIYLKRLSDAIRDGDPVRAVIRGTANNSDGWTLGINSPSSEAQAAAIRAAYADAGIMPDQYPNTGYLECHGTGTPVGDPLEASAAASVLADTRLPSNPLIVGSLKSNIGHSEPAAGISGLIKATLALEKGIIPGNPTFVNPSPNIDFEGLRLRVVRRPVPWPKTSNYYRRASVNSFGYGGSNAHVVLDNIEHFMRKQNYTEAPHPHASSFVDADEMLRLLTANTTRGPTTSVNPPQLLVFSANDQASLKRQIEALASHLLNPRVKVKLSDLSYTLSERRSRHFYRAYVLGHPSKTDQIQRISAESAKFAKNQPDKTTVGFIFTGQGAQWSQMGESLLTMMPETAKQTIDYLDQVLQELPPPLRPQWTLFQELSEPRAAEHLRQPEYSQPLVTALQLAQLAVLDTWKVKPSIVIGHSSGEIAAACKAGFLSQKQAILVAYFRGLAAKRTKSVGSHGMLAVGLDEKRVQPYLDRSLRGRDVVVACYNSPSSITLAGPSDVLTELAGNIKTDGNFARLLQVDVGYHSIYMNEIADEYEKLLKAFAGLGNDHHNRSGEFPKMISTVTEMPLNNPGECDVDYWKANMLSPVRFEGACKAMFNDQSLAPDILVELGPGKALASPIAQTLKENRSHDMIYCAASDRGTKSLDTLLEVAGQLFLHNADISLVAVNKNDACNGSAKPAVIVDLPNYQWNRSTRYWHETLASKDWRFKNFVEHDLLGSKVLGTLWQCPTWHKTLRLSDSPWLRDHRIGTEILFPAAGYIVMAAEAICQVTLAVSTESNSLNTTTRNHQYCMRKVRFSRGLVLEDDNEADLMTTLVPSTGDWWDFKIMSMLESEPAITSVHPEKWIENCRGQVRIATNGIGQRWLAPKEVYGLPLEDPQPGDVWYKAMRDAGYSFGPEFRKIDLVESMEGDASSRVRISLASPQSAWEPQSTYPLHPTALDSCLQSAFVSLHHGNRSSFEEVLLPDTIDELVLAGQSGLSGYATSTSTTNKNRSSDFSVYSSLSGDMIMDVKGLKFSPISVKDSVYASHTYARLAWQPDLEYLDSDAKLQFALNNCANDRRFEVYQLLDMAAHKTPDLRAFECNLLAESTESFWIDTSLRPGSAVTSLNEFHYTSNSADKTLAVQQRYLGSVADASAHFRVADLSKTGFSLADGTAKFDLIIVCSSFDKIRSDSETIARNCYPLLAKRGRVVLFTLDVDDGMCTGDIVPIWRTAGFQKVRKTAGGNCLLADLSLEEDIPKNDMVEQDSTTDIYHLRLCSQPHDILHEVISQLRGTYYHITDIGVDDGSKLDQLPSSSTILVLDELIQPTLASVDRQGWEALQAVVRRGCSIVWVTQGSQIKPDAPLKALCHGLFRSIRAENPLARIITLDVESAAPENLTKTIEAIHSVVKQSVSAEGRWPESEIAERDGVMYTSRVLPDHIINRLTRDDESGHRSPISMDLHSSENHIRLVADRTGKLDAVHFENEEEDRPPLGPEEVEIEVFASGCNFEDVDAALGSHHGKVRKLGQEGSGLISQVGISVKDLCIGQKVAFIGIGCFTNRIIVPSSMTIPIRENMTLKEAATIPIAFSSGLYGLRHLAKVQSGQRVLVHCELGPVGIAFISLCQSSNYEVFVATNDSDVRHVLVQDLGIPADHIVDPATAASVQVQQSSWNASFDVVVSRLHADTSISELWRLLAPEGTLVALGKHSSQKDGLLPIQTTANCCLRILDVLSLPSHRLAELLRELSVLLDNNQVKPISQHETFGWHDIPSAFELLHRESYFGKVIISRNAKEHVTIMARPPKYSPSGLLRPDRRYILVGGLKGICGSLAIHLASHGVRHLTVMSRSGDRDNVSRRIARNIRSLGCSLDLVQGDVTSVKDVRKCFSENPIPIGGVIQGAAVFRDRTFELMSHADYLAAMSCKVQGSLNLHMVSLELKQPPLFFTMLSSISGVIGQKGQANYAAGNAFQDALAAHRRTLGLPAISIDLGPVEDVGIIHMDEDLQRRFESDSWSTINEALLRRIFDHSLVQQHSDPPRRINVLTETQMITGLAFPQPADSDLLQDSRFQAWRPPKGGAGFRSPFTAETDIKLRAFLLLIETNCQDYEALLSATVAVVSSHLVKKLRLSEEMHAERPLMQYGIDSLAAVDFRNWLRTTIKVELTTLDIVNAASLSALCKKILTKLGLLITN